MADVISVANFFRRKAAQWASQSGSPEQYIRKAGRIGLAEEFKLDPEFVVVCEFARELGELQLRSNIQKNLEQYVSSVFGVPVVGLLDVVLYAVADACGYRALGDQLLEAAGKIFLLFLGGIVVASLFSRSE